MRWPKAPPSLETIACSITEPMMFVELIEQIDDSRYHHWHELRHRAPPNWRGQPLTSHLWWFFLKIKRAAVRVEVRTSGRPFFISLDHAIQSSLRQIDQHFALTPLSTQLQIKKVHQSELLINAHHEEAIASSMLEGAVTTRRVARELLRSDRRPASHGERMVWDNDAGLNWVAKVRHDAISVRALLELHRLLTQSTLSSDIVGCFQSDQGQRVSVVDKRTGEVIYCPPSVDQIAPQMARLCQLCNGEGEYKELHPVVRACLAHLWLAWIHPFADGNGRTARALFYWVMLKSNYELIEYLPISRLLRQAPAHYARLFLWVETDELDTTYFVRYHLQIILKAVVEFDHSIKTKLMGVDAVEQALSQTLNHRQLALLHHALREEGTAYTIVGHQRSHGVVYQTARSDLLQLVRRQLLIKRKRGRRHVFFSGPALKELIL